jgi:hypothetical protein
MKKNDKCNQMYPFNRIDNDRSRLEGEYHSEIERKFEKRGERNLKIYEGIFLK